MILPRRKFLRGLVGLVAAPAIVKVANIMPVSARALIEPPPPLIRTDGLGIHMIEIFYPEGGGQVIRPTAPFFSEVWAGGLRPGETYTVRLTTSNLFEAHREWTVSSEMRISDKDGMIEFKAR